jgi:transposase
MDPVQLLREKYKALALGLTEWGRRRWAATEARAIGRGGATRVSEATGISLPTIRRGLRELEEGIEPIEGHQRQSGAGRKRAVERDPTLERDLEALVEPVTRGDPSSPLRWTCKSTTQLAEALQRKGHTVSADTVGRLLKDLDYSLQSVRKTHEGRQHPDRDAQFQYINARVQDFQARGQPVISVDTKKKELVGSFKNAGREWHPKGRPEQVNVYDFPSLADGKAIPYGVYDMQRNEGWVGVGIDHDTSSFAIATIQQWWRKMGKPAYPAATELLMTADSGGSNSARNHLWKVELQRLADETGLRLHVCHFPPGTSKWNKIEHRMFCHITQNWRSRPLVNYEVIVNLIANTRTSKGLRIRAELDHRCYPTDVEVTKEQLTELRIQRDEFHGDWNYTISPRANEK